MAAGRPIEYSEERATKAKEYIDSCEDEVTQVVTGESDKFTSYKEKIKVKMPSIEGLAYYLKIHKDTIYEWEKIYPEFSDVINVLRYKQAERLINMGLSGDYNAHIAKALLAKHGYIDRTEIKHEVQKSFFNLDPLADDQTNQGAQENSPA
jgi:FMN phosphatase YigB (HAD superfamily)